MKAVELKGEAKDRLAALVTRRRREENAKALAPVLERAGINHSFLSDEAQDNLIAKLQSPGELLHDRLGKMQFESAKNAFFQLQQAAGACFPQMSVFISYDVENGRAFLAPTAATLSAVEQCPSLISQDGLVVLAPDGCSGAIVDYQDGDTPFEIELTLLGHAA